ncbi:MULTISPECIES: cytosine permease [Caballeronia]|uniref:cytosine permease n=1 Tax=Caballeronia TaxID=1827195 RepID=UPI001FD58401|nr:MULTISPECIES: cytosine permease [Caballeronia]MDR5799153.1 cytosine permease [Caballeronia sp. LZ001]
MEHNAKSVEQEALAGRLPVLFNERIYRSYGSFLWTCCAFSAATWAFLIGGFLPYVGDWRLGVAGYVIGLVIGMSIVTLASGAASFKYGTDVIDSAKATFGYRGIIVPLIGLLATLIGWSFVVEALTSRGAANIAATITGTGPSSAAHEKLVIIVALGALVIVWLIAAKGPKLFERLNGYIGPLHMLITVGMFGILVYRFGLHALWVNQLPADQMLTHDKTRGLALAVEFGFSNALTWWPVMGGLSRLVKRRSHVMGPSVLGVGLLGAAFVSTVAALAAISAGTHDPTIWMIKLAGPIFGSVTMGVVLLANIATMVVMIYLAGVSVQQIPLFARIKWELLLAAMLLPGIYFAFKTEWLLSAVMSWLSYNGVMFVGITGITLVDYFFLRKERIDPAHLFASSGSKYTFWGGVNWIAIVITGLSVLLYLWLYNPVTSATAEPFKYFGASIPVVVLSGFVYYIATKVILVPLALGGYREDVGPLSRATVGRPAESGSVTVSL